MKDVFKVSLGIGLGILIVGTGSCANINIATPYQILGIFVSAVSLIGAAIAEAM